MPKFEILGNSNYFLRIFCDFYKQGWSSDVTGVRILLFYCVYVIIYDVTKFDLLSLSVTRTSQAVFGPLAAMERL